MRYLAACGALAVAWAFWSSAAVDQTGRALADSSPPAAPPSQAQAVDPADWGGDHIDQPLPEFMTGSECLFCHRRDVGPTWDKNRHGQTVRRVTADTDILQVLRAEPATLEVAKQVEFVLGSRRQVRFLKRGPKYGQLSLLTTSATPKSAAKQQRLTHAEHPRWDAAKFGKNCAGCHASGLDSRTDAFTAVSLDCFTCHGDITLEHTRDSRKALLAKQRHDPPRVVVSICGQCHIRSGRSRSTGRRFANNFVAGDNLFRDLKLDWSSDGLESLEPVERHIMENVRDVVLRGRTDMDCRACHDVHRQSTVKHRTLSDGLICRNCHQVDGSLKGDLRKPRHSRVCEY